MTFLAFLAAVAALVGLLLAAVWLAGPLIRELNDAPRAEDVADGD